MQWLTGFLGLQAGALCTRSVLREEGVLGRRAACASREGALGSLPFPAAAECFHLRGAWLAAATTRSDSLSACDALQTPATSARCSPTRAPKGSLSPLTYLLSRSRVLGRREEQRLPLLLIASSQVALRWHQDECLCPTPAKAPMGSFSRIPNP